MREKRREGEEEEEEEKRRKNEGDKRSKVWFSMDYSMELV